MSNDAAKKPTRITLEAHELLKEFCDRTGRTQVDVLTELTMRFIKPELDRLEASRK